jgi:hypothetical protein
MADIIAFTIISIKVLALTSIQATKNTNNIFTIFTSPENGNKCFAYVIGSNAYFLGYGKESNQDDWEQLASYKSLLASNTLKF